MDIEGYGEFGGISEEDDDIARFERQCAERARAEGALPEEGSEDEDEQIKRKRLVTGGQPQDINEWQEKCELLHDKLGRKEGELAQVKADLEMLRNDGLGPEDSQTALKQRLLDLTKKNRRLQVTVDGQRVRLQQLEVEVKKPKEDIKKQAEELIMQNAALLYGEAGNVEDWKKKYLTTSNQLQQVRHETQEMRALLQKQKKVLLKELGAEEAIQQALAVADDPMAVQWKGRAAQIAQLQRQVKELKAGGGSTSQEVKETPSASAVKSKAVGQAADKRREEFERLQEEVERLRAEQAECKQKREALRSRSCLLETQLRDMKANVQFLLRKSDDDDALVAMLRKQLGREDNGADGGDELTFLRQQNGELQAQLERQAQIMLQLRQKTLSASCENGSVPLGPKSVETSVTERQLLERVRFLEAENAKQAEQVHLLKARGAMGYTETYRQDTGDTPSDRGRHTRQGSKPFSESGSEA